MLNHCDRYLFRLLNVNQLTCTFIFIFVYFFKGMFLQVWPTASTNLSIDGNITEGEIIFIPYKKILIVPATTIHGGGFRTTTFVEEPGRCGNLRFHLYLAASATTGTGTGATLPAHQTNKYTEPHDKTKELSRRYVDSKYMQVLLQNLFV